MSKRKTPYSRIAITLPPSVLAAADRLARQMDRSRSWVIAEAIRRFATGPEAGERASSLPPVREPVWAGYAATEVASGRLRQLEAGLALSPTERLRRADELLQLARLVRPRTRRQQVISFGSWEDFARWKAAQRVRS